MRENRILVEPFHFINYLSFNCVQELNHHGKLRIEGLIDGSQAEKYEKLAENELWITVKIIDENETEYIFFNGVLTGWELRQVNGNSILMIEMHTGSYLLDLESHIRSFQTDTFLYADIIKCCLNESGGKYIRIKYPIRFQYGMRLKNIMMVIQKKINRKYYFLGLQEKLLV